MGDRGIGEPLGWNRAAAGGGGGGGGGEGRRSEAAGAAAEKAVVAVGGWVEECWSIVFSSCCVRDGCDCDGCDAGSELLCEMVKVCG